MSKALLKFTLLSAASAMLVVSARAQSDSQNNDQSSRSWSTKQLSATGRMSEPVVTGRKMLGAQVNDSSGTQCGLIQDLIVNPRSGQIEFALLSLNTNPGLITSTSGNDLVPVPWSLLRPSAGSQYSATTGLPVFTANVAPDKFKSAPTVSQTDLNQSQWRQRVYAYYGATPPSNMGGAESDQGEMKGQGARELQQGNQEAPQAPATK